jgi:hypothetical protein
MLLVQVPLLLEEELRVGQFPLQELEVPGKKEPLSLQHCLVPPKDVHLMDDKPAVNRYQELNSQCQPPGLTPHQIMMMVQLESVLVLDHLLEQVLTVLPLYQCLLLL